MINEASMMANKLMIMHSAKLIAKMKSGDEKENKISELEKKAKKLGFSRAEYERILDKQNAYESVVREEAEIMNAYVDGISKHKSLFYEQEGVRKVDFVDGVTPEIAEEKCEECGKDPCECEVEEGVAQYLAKKGQFEVKYAASKKGPIKVTKFASLDKAKEFLANVKKDGMNGLISKGGKPIKEENVDEGHPGFAAAMQIINKKKKEKEERDKKKKNEDIELEEHCGECEESIDERMTKDDLKKFKVKKTKTSYKDAKKDNEDRRAAQRKKLGLEARKMKKGLEESKYELYHKDFSTAMQHAYAHAKKQGFIVDPEEIDNKVATGPRKPSKGKTNRYILGTDKKKSVHIQIANLDNKKYELNMYIEETEKEVKKTVKKMAHALVPTGEEKEDHDDPKGYEKKVKMANKKFGIKSPNELEGKKKKSYFDFLDSIHKAKGEKPEANEVLGAVGSAVAGYVAKKVAGAAVDAVTKKKEPVKKNTEEIEKNQSPNNPIKKEKKKPGIVKKLDKILPSPDHKDSSKVVKGGQKLPSQKKPGTGGMKQQAQSYVPPTGNFLEDTKSFLQSLWEKQAGDEEIDGPPPVPSAKTMTKKTKEDIKINPKEEE